MVPPDLGNLSAFLKEQKGAKGSTYLDFNKMVKNEK
jgi:hypothetical protein